LFSPERYVDALRFSAVAHQAQTMLGSDLPYLVHVVSVAGEVIAALPLVPGVDADLAVTCALLHDTVEDTAITVAEIRARFGDAVAAGVAALSKDPALTDKTAAMVDSLRRITCEPREIAIVKLADRITNMAEPPAHWDKAKREAYRAEATVIADTLGYASPALEARLRVRIETYAAYCR
jgi:(p)ppGpp synthase/HD superfamily hydrolase